MTTEVSYIKTQWWRLLIALYCLVMCCIYAFKPAPEVLTVEALNKVLSNMLTANLHFIGFIIWSFLSFVNYNQDRIELLEKRAEKYDALCEEVGALYEANRIDREYMRLLERKINQLKYDMENRR